MLIAIALAIVVAILAAANSKRRRSTVDAVDDAALYRAVHGTRPPGQLIFSRMIIGFVVVAAVMVLIYLSQHARLPSSGN